MIKQKDIYVQIGANSGNDYFFELVRKLENRSKIFLIEPNGDLIESLRQCYGELSKVHDVTILNVGISYSNKNILYKYDGDHNGGLSSVLIRKSYPNVISNITFTPMTFDELCVIIGDTHIKFLCIDTEGYDYTILNNIDIDRYKIDTVECEVWPYDEDSDIDIKTGPSFFNNVIAPKYDKLYDISKCMREMETHIFNRK